MKLSNSGAVLGTYGVSGHPSTISILEESGTLVRTTSLGFEAFGPSGIVFDQQGFAWVSLLYIASVGRVTPEGTLQAMYPVENRPRGLAIDLSGNIWIPNAGPDRSASAAIAPGSNTVTKLAP